MGEERVVNRLAELAGVKSRRERRTINAKRVIDETDLAVDTVYGYWNNTVSRFDGSVILRLCKYLDCTLGELLVIEVITEVEPSPEMESPLLPA